jgi:hypothetical protein
MDLENYDDFGGVEHLKYCFEVCIGHFIFMLFKAGECLFCFVCLLHAKNFDQFFPPIWFGLSLPKSAASDNAIFRHNFHLVWRVPLYICLYGLILSGRVAKYWILSIGVAFVTYNRHVNGLDTGTAVSYPTAYI